MNTPSGFVVYDVAPAIVLMVGIVCVARIFWQLGLRSAGIDGLSEPEGERRSLPFVIAEMHEVPQNAPESGLAELSHVMITDRNEVIRILGAADIRFWNKIRRLEVWASICRYLAWALTFITLAYVSSTLQRMQVGLTAELEHSVPAILDVLFSLWKVIFRNTCVVFLMLLLRTIVGARISQRKERWASLVNSLTRLALGEQ
jgi:hypothetical protein